MTVQEFYWLYYIQRPSQIIKRVKLREGEGRPWRRIIVMTLQVYK